MFQLNQPTIKNQVLTWSRDLTENATGVRVYDGSTKIAEGTSGSVVWKPVTSSSRTLKLMAYNSNGTSVGQESITRSFSHIEVVTTAAKAATCMDAGCTRDSYCSRCNAILSTSQTIAALGHAEVVTTTAKAATCTEVGCTKGSYCSRCNAVLSTSQTLAALGHSGVVTKVAVVPTSSAAGSRAEIRCSRCNELMQASEVIPALGYVRNVTARQLWPHNKVALEFTVADDVGEVECPVLSVWCARGSTINTATCILGDCSVQPGVHRIVWDMEADGLKFAYAKTIFGVDVVSAGVQLWENGPYWAECNVGASKPEEYGYYFWWGDTVGYKRNAGNSGWVSAKDGTSYSFYSCPTDGKNNSQLQSEGYIDSTGNLVASHDAATVHLGAPWRLPTGAEFLALINNCDTQWTTRGGVYGRLVTGKGAYASKSIFLPAAGNGIDSDLYGAGSCGVYRFSTSYSDDSGYAWYLYFYSSDFYCGIASRYYGQSVRPVRGFAK